MFLLRERRHLSGCILGGQTALNCAVELADHGIYEQYGVL